MQAPFTLWLFRRSWSLGTGGFGEKLTLSTEKRKKFREQDKSFVRQGAIASAEALNVAGASAEAEDGFTDFRLQERFYAFCTEHILFIYSVMGNPPRNSIHLSPVPTTTFTTKERGKIPIRNIYRSAIEFAGVNRIEASLKQVISSASIACRYSTQSLPAQQLAAVTGKLYIYWAHPFGSFQVRKKNVV